MTISEPNDNLPNTQQLELGEDHYSIGLRKAWDRTLRTLANNYNKPTFENFLRPLTPLSFDGEIVVLGAPSAFAREWAEKKYSQALRTHLQQHLDVKTIQVRFVISTPEVQPLLGEKPITLQQAASPLGQAAPDSNSLSGVRDSIRQGSLPQRSEDGYSQSFSGGRNPYSLELAAIPLNARYTFDQFVVGKSNRLAYAGAVAVADAPGATYNPLFLYGNPGLGKTHLMHAIGNKIRESLPQARVAYVSGETFTNHYVGAIRDKRTEDFRRAYRNVDVWLIDDIQTIASKEQTKEEFFHTFNTLQQLNKQVVIASDRSPRDLRAMDERLRSRFECGLIADVSPPDFDMRRAILQQKADQEQTRIPEEVIAFMANLIQSNIRALEGALIKLLAYASMAKSPVTKQLASDVLSSYFVERMPQMHAMPSARAGDFAAIEAPREVGLAGATVDQIIDTVAVQLGIEREAILAAGSRRKDLAFARQATMYLCREMSQCPMNTLAATFGCKHHSAIAHAHARMRETIESDPKALAIISNIRRVIEYSM